MGDVVLRCSGLRKRYGDRDAVLDVGFEIEAGETYGLLGPNGAGKTTTISMIAGLLRRDAGEVELAGHEVGPRTVRAKAALGLVPQELAVYPDLTGRENLRFFARLYGLRGRMLDQRVDEVLEVVGLADRRDDRVDEYSGGMQRRLNIGIGLLHRPELLILDEPTVGVDPQSRNAILDAVAHLSGAGLAVLYTTHYMEEAERLCDRIGILDHGRVMAQGTTRELTRMVGEQDRLVLRLNGETEAPAAAARAVPGVASVAATSTGIELLVDDASARLAPVLAAVAADGTQIAGVDVDQPDLEAVFMHLTGRALRD